MDRVRRHRERLRCAEFVTLVVIPALILGTLALLWRMADE
jgi:ABC-type uncharacterized transport system involved in gliding motility auxiliary subunit